MASLSLTLRLIRHNSLTTRTTYFKRLSVLTYKNTGVILANQINRNQFNKFVGKKQTQIRQFFQQGNENVYCIPYMVCSRSAICPEVTSLTRV